MKVFTTGMPWRRENSRSSLGGVAADHAIAGKDEREGRGLDELARRPARAGRSGEGRRARSVDSGVPSAVSSATSSGTSMWQAPGFSDSASLNALRMTSGTTPEISSAGVPLGQGPHRLDDVHVLVRLLVDAVAAALPGDGHQRRAVEVGVGDPGGEIGRAGAEGGQADPRAAGEPAPGVRHEGGPLLVPRGHELDPRVHQGVEDVEDLLAGDAEDVAHAFVLQTPRDDVGCLHVRLPRSRLCVGASGASSQPSPRARGSPRIVRHCRSGGPSGGCPQEPNDTALDAGLRE